MKTFLYILFLLIKEYKNDYKSFTRQSILQVIIFSTVITLFLLPICYTYLKQAPFQTAEYDLKLTGPLTQADLIDIKRDRDIKELVAVTEFITNISNPDTNQNLRGHVLFVNDVEKASRLLPSNKRLLIGGGFNKGEAVISAQLANQLKLKIGDYIKINWADFKIDNQATFRIGGILYETDKSKTVVVDSSSNPEILDNVVKKFHNPIPYTSFFLKFYPESNHKFILREDANAILEWKRDALEAQKEEVKRLNSLNFKYVKIGSLLLYISIFIWGIYNQINRRTKTYAVLSALGSSLRFIYTHFILDVFILYTIVIVFSSYLTTMYFKYILNFYFPKTILLQMLLFSTISNVLIALVSSIFAFRKLGKLRLAEILRGE